MRGCRVTWNKKIVQCVAATGLLALCAVHAVAASGNNASSSKYEEYILTPAPGPAPHINGPKVFGARPGRPFIYRIPCTGERPMKFGAENLPKGLALDAASGIIAGNVPTERGDYDIVLKATNGRGSDRRAFRLVVGDKLALTPPMGWNDWYIHYDRITERKMREAADVMISSGLADVGYMYVNIDDCWMKKKDNPPYRDKDRAVLPNEKFPDIKGMVDYIHAKGLRAGLYTSPGEWTCAGYVGSYYHEAEDAKRFAEWGFDFLKYDWCSYMRRGTGQKDYERPYMKMGRILASLDRDIVFNLCQYGMGDVWEWGAAAGGNSWRTTGDLGLEKDASLPGFYKIGMMNARHYRYAGPGAWNDPDYILIGWVGNAHGMGEGTPTTLTPNEQYSYMSMWSLMASPLIFSGDMAKLDKFTLNVLANPEVIDVDQDPLGKQAWILRETPDEFVLVKPMEDGSLAVGLFHLGEGEKTLSVTWKELGIEGRHQVRDLWRNRDVGSFQDGYSEKVGRHGVSLVRISKAPSHGGVR